MVCVYFGNAASSSLLLRMTAKLFVSRLFSMIHKYISIILLDFIFPFWMVNTKFSKKKNFMHFLIENLRIALIWWKLNTFSYINSLLEQNCAAFRVQRHLLLRKCGQKYCFHSDGDVFYYDRWQIYNFCWGLSISLYYNWSLYTHVLITQFTPKYQERFEVFIKFVELLCKNGQSEEGKTISRRIYGCISCIH